MTSNDITAMLVSKRSPLTLQHSALTLFMSFKILKGSSLRVRYRLIHLQRCFGQYSLLFRQFESV